MHKYVSILLASLVASIGMVGSVWAEEAKKPMPGQEVAFNRSTGNCLACHAMPGVKADMPGSIAPPLIIMKQRFPDRAKLRAQIWDASVANPKTSMPPFGKHNILTESEIDQVVDFIQTL